MRETGSKSKKQSMKIIRGVGWGYMIQNQISPDFGFPEVSISAIPQLAYSLITLHHTVLITVHTFI